MLSAIKTNGLFLLALALYLVSCNSHNNSFINTSKAPVEEITAHNDTAEGLADISLSIDSSATTDSTIIYISKGLYKGNPVGLKFEVKKNMLAGISSSGEIEGDGFTSNGVRLSSIGPQSDKFVQALSELYGVPTSKPFTKQAIAASVFSLNQKTASLDEKGSYEFKLFFEGKTDSASESEIFFNIDLNKGIIELPEKDESFRQDIINIMTN